jgi:Na+/H+-dicarboxylate symporter
MKLWLKILIALALGVITGLLVHEGWLPNEVASVLQVVGNIFLSMINMLIVPLIFGSMTVGITSIHDPQKLGRVGLKTLLLYFFTTMFAIFLGITFAELLRPGAGVEMSLSEAPLTTISAPDVSHILQSIIPSNPIAAMVNGNMLQIIAFSIFLGISINFAGSKGKPLLQFLESLADVMYRMTSIVMEFSPVGVFAFMTAITASFGVDAIVSLMKFLLVYYGACVAHILIVFCGILSFSKLNPLPFFRGMGDAIMVAFSTCSSSATLPVSMHCVQKNLGISKNITNFVLPLGASLNMNGAAIFQGMAAVFIAQVFNIELDWKSLLMIVTTATLSTIGAASVPTGSYVMLSVVFASVGLPKEGIAMLLGIDRVREMVSTVLNVLGDAVCAVYIAKQENELDERQYYHHELVELEPADG